MHYKLPGLTGSYVCTCLAANKLQLTLLWLDLNFFKTFLNVPNKGVTD